jgi:hypothetical protein
MIQPVAFINRELARWLPVLPCAEVKALLALMLQANVAGFLRTTPHAFAARAGVSPWVAEHLLRRLAQRRIIVIEPQGTCFIVQIRGFLGGRGAPHDALIPSLSPGATDRVGGEPTERGATQPREIY